MPNSHDLRGSIRNNRFESAGIAAPSLAQLISLAACLSVGSLDAPAQHLARTADGEVAQANGLAAPADTVAAYKAMSLQDLMNLDVTSVAKQPEAFKNAAAAINVITQDEIRRSGAASQPPGGAPAGRQPGRGAGEFFGLVHQRAGL